MTAAPKLVIDAKALYDLLIRPEVQANSGTDKRTTIEVLVTQDKLACCGAETNWVSSEQQYADGLTKQAAAQLLADRLRSHMVKLKSDTSFQASKKKTPQERKRNTEMYAVKKPARAMMAMFCACWTGVTGASAPETTTSNFHYILVDGNFSTVLMNMILATVIYMMMMMMIFPPTSWRPWWRSLRETEVEAETLQEASKPTMIHAEVQTDEMMDDLVPLDIYVAESERLDRDYVLRTVHEARLDTCHRDMDRMHDTWRAERHALIQNHEAHLRHLTQQPVFYTKNGRAWHAHRECLQRWATNPIQEKTYCVHCAHLLGKPWPDDEDH